MIEMKVEGVGVDAAHRPVVLLREAAGDRQLPIWIGPMEALAIAEQLSGGKSPRPMTHDLLCSILQETGCAVDALSICDVRESIYYARLHLTVGQETREVDCRPSDGIAVALRAEAPICIPDDLLDRVSSEQKIEVERGGDADRFLGGEGDTTIH